MEPHALVPNGGPGVGFGNASRRSVGRHLIGSVCGQRSQGQSAVGERGAREAARRDVTDVIRRDGGTRCNYLDV